jgi:hypothetical protein
MDLREIGIDGANWVRLAQDRVQWRVLWALWWTFGFHKESRLLFERLSKERLFKECPTSWYMSIIQCDNCYEARGMCRSWILPVLWTLEVAFSKQCLPPAHLLSKSERSVSVWSRVTCPLFPFIAVQICRCKYRCTCNCQAYSAEFVPA